MSRLIGPFDPGVTTTDSFDTTFGASGTGTLIGHNLSQQELKLDFGNGNIKILPAWSGRRFDLCVPTPSATYTVVASPSQNSPPLSVLYFEAYAQNEQINEQFPVAYTRLTSIGNNVPLGQSSTSVQNDGNAVGTTVVEATPTGATSSYLLMKNDGTLLIAAISQGVLTNLLQVTPGGASAGASVVLGSTSNGASTTVDGTVSHATSADSVPAAGVGLGTLANGVDLTQVYSDAGAITSDGGGNLTVSGIKVTTNIGTAKILLAYDATGNGHAALIAPQSGASPHGTYFQTWNGSAAVVPFSVGEATGLAYVDTAGLIHGTVTNAQSATSATSATTAGSVSNLHAISYFSGTGSGTFNHGLGTTPSWVGITTTEPNSTETVGVDSINGTSVHVNQGTTGWPWIGVAVA